MPKNKLNKPLYPPKNHQNWAKLKSNIHNSITKRNPYREGEIYWFYFGNNIGVEEDGKHELYNRPAIIIRGFSDALIWVIPLSRTKRNGEYYFTFTQHTPKHGCKTSKAILSQMRPFDTSRIGGKLVGWVDESTLDKIKIKVAELLLPIKSRS